MTITEAKASMTLQEAAADYARAVKRVRAAGDLKEKAKKALDDSEHEYVDARLDLTNALSWLESIAEDQKQSE